jgi:hypothetical protein
MAKIITIYLLVFWEIFFEEHLKEGYKHKIYVGSAVLLRLSYLAALCIEVVPKYRLHCGLPSSAEMSQIFVCRAVALIVEISAWSNGKNAAVEKKIWRNNGAILHFVFDTVHNTLNTGVLISS